MSLKEGLYSYLTGSATFANVIGTNAVLGVVQLYADQAPTVATTPYVVYSKLSGKPDQSFDGDTGWNKDRILFEISSDTSDNRETLRKMLKSLLSGLNGVRMGDMAINLVRLDDDKDHLATNMQDGTQFSTYQAFMEFMFEYNETPPILV